MSGPWERYAAQAEEGPWTKYQATKKEAPTVSDSSIVALGAGLGKSTGNAALNLQRYLGKGLDAIGADGAGQWLVKDAERGLEKIGNEVAPYKEQSPIATGGGELAGSILATLPVGGFLAKGAQALGAPAAFVNSIASSGFRTGLPAATTAAGKAGNALTRILGGGVTGGVSAGLIDPESAKTGAVIGALLPPVVQTGGIIGNNISRVANSSANRLMQSALKPSIKDLQTGDAAIAVRTLLDEGINPNAGGVNKLQQIIGGINDDIAQRIQSSNALIDKGRVVDALGPVRQRAMNQVSPTSDLNAISGVVDDFMAHPAFPGQTIPIQSAQEIKQGTYRALAKKYGQLGNAEVEAQKGLARGLKEEIADAIPEIAGLNARESQLITTLKVAERRALMELNKNPVGFASLASNPGSWALFMADKSALFKSLAARMLNASANRAQTSAPILEGPATNPLLRAAPAVFASTPE